MKGRQNLQRYLDEHEVEAEIVQLETEVRTVAMAARAMNVSQHQIVKSLLFMAAGEPVLVIGLGPERIEPAVIAGYCQVDPAQVELASPEQVVAETGYAVGTVPPIGGADQLTTLIDQRVMDQSLVIAGGGSHDSLLKIAPGTLLKHSRGQLVNLSQDMEADSGHQA